MDSELRSNSKCRALFFIIEYVICQCLMDTVCRYFSGYLKHIHYDEEKSNRVESVQIFFFQALFILRILLLWLALITVSP